MTTLAPGSGSPGPAVSPRRNPMLHLYSLIKDGGNEEKLQQFLESKKNAVWLDRRDSNGETALMVATKHNRTRELDILLNHGANPNTANAQGETALHMAVSSGHVDAIRKLLERGAAVNIIGPQGTPRDVAVKSSAHDVVKMLDASSNVGVGAKPLPGVPARGAKPTVRPRGTVGGGGAVSPPSSPSSPPTVPVGGSLIATRARPLPPVHRPPSASVSGPRPSVLPRPNVPNGNTQPPQRPGLPTPPSRPSLIQPFGVGSSASSTSASVLPSAAARSSPSLPSPAPPAAVPPPSSPSSSLSSLSSSGERPTAHTAAAETGRLRSVSSADTSSQPPLALHNPVRRPPPRPARRESTADVVPPLNFGATRPMSLTTAPVPSPSGPAAGWQTSSPRGERGPSVTGMSPRATMPPGALAAVSNPNLTSAATTNNSSTSSPPPADGSAVRSPRATTVFSGGTSIMSALPQRSATVSTATAPPAERKRSPRHTVTSADIVISGPSPPSLAGSRIGADPNAPFSPGQVKKEDPLMMRRRAAEEILTTEVAYVDQLSMLINGYKKPIEASKVLDRMSLKGIFVNVEVLESLHRTFLSDLQQQMEHWSPENESPGLSSVILSLVPYLKLYIEYITDFDRSLKLVESLYNENEAFQQLIQSLGSGGFIGRMGLESLRVVPIQRIPRYVLLLKALIKYTPDDHPDHKNLEEALNKMSELATFINTKKSEAESRNRLIELSANLVGKRLEALEDAEGEMSGGKEPKEHKWRKKYNKYKQCDVCREMGYCTKCKDKECKFYLGIGGVHADCQQNVPNNCGQRRTEKTFIKHSRHLIKEEKELQHKMTSLKHPDSKAPLRKDAIVLLLNDGLAVVYPTEDAKYEFLALIKWVCPAGKPILNENVTETAFSLTDPRYNELHTFVAPTKEFKEQFLNELKQQMSNWHVAQSKEKEKSSGTSMDQFRGVTFQILFTVPVASTKEKEFTAYVVDMKTQKGTITIMKRYRQFLDLHHRLQNHYKASVLPQFPKKRYLGNNTSPKFIQKRCQKIGKYLNEMMQLPGILEIDEVKTFLTTSLSAKGEEELVGKQDESDQGKAQFLESIAPTPEKKPEEHVGSAEALRAQAGVSMIIRSMPPRSGISGSTISKTDTYAAVPLSTSPGGSTIAGGLAPTSATAEFAATTSPRRSPRGPAAVPTPTPMLTPAPAPKQEEPASTTQQETTPVQKLARAVTLYAFEAQSPKELALNVDDVVTVHEREGETWWFGTVNGTTFGYFPSNYVKLMPEAEW